MKNLNFRLLIVFLAALHTFNIVRAADCVSIVAQVAIPKSLERIIADPVRLLKGRDTMISEGNLLSKWDPKLRTTVYHTASEPLPDGSVPLIDPKAKAVAVFFHGSGTAKASGRNFLLNMHFLANQGVSGVSLDLPSHGTNLGDKQQKDIDYFMRWIHEFMMPIKKSGKPVYLLGHSFGPTVALEYAKRYPKDVAGIYLLGGSWSQYPGHHWMYENVTDPMMALIGGNEVVDSNDAGGFWAGEIEEQTTWHKGEFPESVRVGLGFGVKDEWYSPMVDKKLPAGARLIKPTKYPNNLLGNTGLLAKTKKTSPYTMNDDIKWVQDKIPQAQFDVVDGYGHYIFDAEDPRGGTMINRLMLDFMGIEYSKDADKNTRSARNEVSILSRHNPVFAEWIGTKGLDSAIKDEETAARRLKEWSASEFLAWKVLVENMDSRYPEYYAKRKYWLAQIKKNMPTSKEGFLKDGWDGFSFQSDFRKYLESVEKGNAKLSPDPMYPKVPEIDPTLIGADSKAEVHGGTLLRSIFEKTMGEDGQVEEATGIAPNLTKLTYTLKKQKGREWVVFDGISETEARKWIQDAYFKAIENNGYLLPKDKWEAEVGGVLVSGKVKILPGNKMTSLTDIKLALPVVQPVPQQ